MHVRPRPIRRPHVVALAWGLTLVAWAGAALLTCAFLAFALPLQVARAQGGLDGGLLTWERVGDFAPNAYALAADGDGRLYAMTGDAAYRLDLSGGLPGTWEERNCCVFGDAMVGLGPDTLVSTVDGRTQRSTDGAATWVTVYDDGTSATFGLHEAPEGTPLAGTLFVGGFPFAASEDQGATWEERSSLPDSGLPYAFATLSSGAFAGRLLSGGRWGAAYSDDGGHTWATSSLWASGRYVGDAAAVTASPGGAERALVVGVDALSPHVRAWYSDDGGVTWAPEGGYPLPEVYDGVGGGHTAGAWGLGGARAVVVHGRGSVYATEDGGETWAVVGEVPGVDEATYVYTSAVAPDGRLYVGLLRIGSGEGGWVWRTAERVSTVAAERGPGVLEGLGLVVRPNPSSGWGVVEVTLARPGETRLALYDALGRQIALLHEGVLAAGRTNFGLDGATLPAGVYVVRLMAGGSVLARMVTLVR